VILVMVRLHEVEASSGISLWPASRIPNRRACWHGVKGSELRPQLSFVCLLAQFSTIFHLRSEFVKGRPTL
jgi:hypothetical protein